MLVAGSLIAYIQIMFTTAYNITKNTGVLTSLTTITLIPSYLVSVFLYHESINPFALTGLIFIAGGLIWAIKHSN